MVANGLFDCCGGTCPSVGTVAGVARRRQTSGKLGAARILANPATLNSRCDNPLLWTCLFSLEKLNDESVPHVTIRDRCRLVLLILGQRRRTADRPNILWITAEDMSATLGCYGDSFATTPNIDRFAKQSSRYTHAFATAPVCSPSRACLINGCIATTQGTHAMRSRFHCRPR